MKKNDLFLIVGLLLISLVLGIGLSFYKKNATEEAPAAVVTIDGIEYGTYPLDQDRMERIDLGNGEYNVLEIKDGQAHMSEASCPDQICVLHSHIKYTGESIVCLPHKVLVEIINGEVNDLDGSTH
ncbi:MAG: NusG domain II-containing protein [Pseudobutyrivibrio sp.]|nr:NusG domain II-containing protein [Pseudobutyrivibrio sp.]